MKRFPVVKGAIQTTFPQCPSCRQKRLKKYWIGKGKTEKCIVKCLFCGFQFEKESAIEPEKNYNITLDLFSFGSAFTLIIELGGVNTTITGGGVIPSLAIIGVRYR